MKGKVLSWFTGSVRIQITGGFCERFLNLCAYHNIRLWNLESGKEGYEASLSLANFWKLKPLIHKCHIKIRTVEKCGAPFLLHRYRHRKLLFLSVFAAFALIFSLSFFIWDIEIDGNLSVTDEKITDYLRGEGIAQGIPKSSIDYKLLAARICQSFPVMTWVSVKLQGTRLVISLQENTDTGLVQERTYGPSDLVSNVDGVVTQIITRTGTPLVAAGDEVQKGDLLVSGCIELVNDSAEVYGCRYVAADADIYVKTHLAYEDRIPLNQKEKVYSGKETSRILLEFGSLHLGIPSSKGPAGPMIRSQLTASCA